mmetsp:Transcript_29512/g.41305  ORF Transcript_29512/g.41305 Transcript_29512/m.41305 type:complete len:680 (-) Transcript_29512:384-2423(-)
MLSSIFGGSGGGGGGSIRSKRTSVSGGGPSEVIDAGSIRSQTTDATVVSPLRQLLDAVNMSILPHDLRLSSITQACGFFDHRDRMTHDAELQEGAAFILYQKLSFALALGSQIQSYGDGFGVGQGGLDGTAASVISGSGTTSPATGPTPRFRASVDSSDADHEIALLCSCLEMVHRASPDAIAATWYDIGEDVLPLLVRVMERPFLKLTQAQATARLQQAQLRAKTSSASGTMYSTATLIGSVDTATLSATTRPIINRDLKLAVQKVTKLLAMYSLVPEAKYPLAHCPGLLAVLVKIIDTRHMNRVRPHGPGGTLHPPSHYNSSESFNGVRGSSAGAGLIMTEAARFNTVATLTNLAAAEQNRITMLAEPMLVDNIARIVQNERSDVARQCSALALMNLSNGDKDHVPEMATELLLETLMTLMKDDMPETRRNAAVALFNVACADENTVRVAQFRDGVILDALVEVVSNDDQDDSRANAAETLFNMACSDAPETTHIMASHPGLLESLALVLKSQTATIDVKMYCAATLRRMAEIIRHPMVAQGALLTALVKASSWTRTPDIAEAMEFHAEYEANRLPMAQHHGLLNSLAKLALEPGQGQEAPKVHHAAVSAVERLARDETARPVLAHNESIMAALTRASYGSNGEPSSTGGSIDGGGSSVGTREQMVQVALKNLVAAM